MFATWHFSDYLPDIALNRRLVTIKTLASMSHKKREGKTFPRALDSVEIESIVRIFDDVGRNRIDADWALP